MTRIRIAAHRPHLFDDRGSWNHGWRWILEYLWSRQHRVDDVPIDIVDVGERAAVTIGSWEVLRGPPTSAKAVFVTHDPWDLALPASKSFDPTMVEHLRLIGAEEFPKKFDAERSGVRRPRMSDLLAADCLVATCGTYWWTILPEVYDRIVQIPVAPHPRLARVPPIACRRHDIVLCGSTFEMYPVRELASRLIPRWEAIGVRVSRISTPTPVGRWNLLGEHAYMLGMMMHARVLITDGTLANILVGKYLQGMSCGCVVVAPIPADAEVVGIANGENVIAADPANLYDQIVQILSDDPLMARISCAARRASEDYTVEGNAMRLLVHLVRRFA